MYTNRVGNPIGRSRSDGVPANPERLTAGLLHHRLEFRSELRELVRRLAPTPLAREGTLNTARVGLAGLVATAAVTLLWLVEPVVGLPRLAVGSMLSSWLAVATAYLPMSPTLGWTIHAVIGIGLAFVYATWLVARLPGTPIFRGIGFGVSVFLFAQLVFMPLVGAGVFSRGDLPLLAGSLIGHLFYGALLGLIVGPAPSRPPATATPLVERPLARGDPP